MIAPVTEIAAGNDRAWFGDHPDRRFRARVADNGVWLVRASGMFYCGHSRRARSGRCPTMIMRSRIVGLKPPGQIGRSRRLNGRA